MQPVVQPAVQPVVQPAVSCIQTFSWLYNRLYSRLYNGLHRVYGVLVINAAVGCQQARSYLPTRSASPPGHYQIILFGDRGVNNLPNVSVQRCTARSRSHDLFIASQVLYGYRHHATSSTCTFTGRRTYPKTAWESEF